MFGKSNMTPRCLSVRKSEGKRGAEKQSSTGSGPGGPIENVDKVKKCGRQRPKLGRHGALDDPDGGRDVEGLSIVGRQPP